MNATTEVATSLATGIAAITLTTLGVEPQSLLYAMMGGFVGLLAAPQLGRWKSIVIFVSVMCLCAAVGTWVAQSYSYPHVARNAIAGVLAAVFHPAFAVVVQKLPDIFDGFMKKAGLK